MQQLEKMEQEENDNGAQVNENDGEENEGNYENEQVPQNGNE